MRRSIALKVSVAIAIATGMAAAFPGVAAASSGVLYVAGSGGFDAGAATDTSNNCQSESTPCATLVHALSQAASGATIELSGTVSESAAAVVNLNNITIANNPDGMSATIVGSGDTDGLVTIGAGDAATLQGLTLEDGDNTNGGGAITNGSGDLTITDSTLSDNTGNDGGAVDNSNAGGVAILDSTLSDNTATNDGGAIDNGEHTPGAFLAIVDSTLSDNHAVSGNGGAIDNDDGGGVGDNVIVGTSTLDGNSAGGDGGAIDSDDAGGNGGRLEVFQSTLADDTAVTSGNLIATTSAGAGSGTVYVAADVLDGTCVDLADSWSDDGYNAASDSSCLGGSAAASDATVGTAAGLLLPLANYGGPTQTMLLAPGSSAFGLVPSGQVIRGGPGNAQLTGCTPAYDQRGVPSAAGQPCDAGAVQQTDLTAYASGTGSDYADAANDLNDCSNATTPCATLQGALDQLAPGGTVELSGSFTLSQATDVYANATIATNPADAGAATIEGDAQDSDGLLEINGSATAVTLQRLTLEHGTSTNIANPRGAGAITNNGGAALTIEDSTLADNNGENGGAIDNNDGTSGGSVRIADSTLSGNFAPDGGAIDNDDNTGSGGTVTITESTLSGNSATDGGAVDNDDNQGSGGTLIVTDSTIDNNVGPQLGAEIGNSHNNTGGSVYLAADVLVGTCTNDSTAAGSWTDAGYNAATDGSCLGASPAASDAAVSASNGELGALANNGGATETQALTPGNPAIDLIPHGTSFATGPVSNTVTVACPVVADQRGVASVAGGACDAGASQYVEQSLSFGIGIPSTVVVGQSGVVVSALSSSGPAASVAVDGDQTTHDACTLDAGALTFAHAGLCVIGASLAGGANVAPAEITQTITVTAAGTNTELAYSGGDLSATVDAVAPGGGSPSGTVQFTAGGQILGSASLSGGSAKLAYTAPANGSVRITASFAGNADYGASSSGALSLSGPTVTTTTTTTPTLRISAKLSSSRARSRSGWWTTAVKVTFSCVTHGATLHGSCPAAVVLSRSGKGQRLTRTITTTTGQRASVTVTGINIDRLRPSVRIVGPDPRHAYVSQPPAARCVASERISGIRSCKLSEHRRRVAGGYIVSYSATATSNAGTTARRRLSVRVSSGS